MLNSISVPIYDGRESFVAPPAQLNQIGSSSYPLYKDSKEDLLPGSITCVGYTTYTWQSSGLYKAPPLWLSLNIQFVVLLALPPGISAPSPPSTPSSHPFPRLIYNTPTHSAAFPGPPPCNRSDKKQSSSQAMFHSAALAGHPTGSSSVSHQGQEVEDESPYLSSGSLKDGYEYHEDL